MRADKLKNRGFWLKWYRDYAAKWRERNSAKCKLYRQTSLAKNKDKIYRRNAEYIKTPHGRIARFIGNTNSRLRRYKSHLAGHARELLGVDYTTAANILASMFTDGMSWANYGIDWEIDHKRPLVLLKRSSPTYAPALPKEILSIKNLRPLARVANIEKSDDENPF